MNCMDICDCLCVNHRGMMLSSIYFYGVKFPRNNNLVLSLEI